jgi:hypothetical protein
MAAIGPRQTEQRPVFSKVSELQLQLASNLLHNFWLGCGSYSRDTNPYIDRRPDALVEDLNSGEQEHEAECPSEPVTPTLGPHA